MFNKINLSFFGTSLGYSISLILIPLIILNITKSALLVSISYALDVVPYILFTPFIGVIGDRYNKKNLIILGESFCLVSSIILISIPHEVEYVYVLMLLGFFISSFSAMHHPIFQSILPELYSKDKLAIVNSNIASISSLTGIIAPAIIAIMFLFFNNKQIAFIIVLSYITSLFSFSLIQHSPVSLKISQGGGKGFFMELKDAILFIKSDYNLSLFSLLFLFANFGLKMVFSSLIWIYTSYFRLDNYYMAINFVIIGILSILGAKIAGKYIVNKFSNSKIIIYSLFLISLITLSIMLSDNFVYLTFAWGMTSFLSMFIVVTFFTYRQTITPINLLGRVISITRLISFISIPPATILSGYLLSKYNQPYIIYLISGIIMLISSIFFHLNLISHKKYNKN